MLSLAENRQTVWYADYKGMVDVLDADGNIRKNIREAIQDSSV